MKCLYTESDITQSSSQIMLCPASADNKIFSDEQSRFKKAFPDAWIAYQGMYGAEKYGGIPPKLGDVVWTQTSGNKYIGFCIVKRNKNAPINKKALRLCLYSAANKAKTLNNKYLGMDLFCCKDGKEWSNIVKIIENCLEDIQNIVCIPTNEKLVDVLEQLPGHQFQKIEAKIG